MAARQKRLFDDAPAQLSIKLSASDVISGVAREVLNVLSSCARGLPADAAVWDLSLLQIEGCAVRRQTVLSWLDKAYLCTYGEPFAEQDQHQQQHKRQRRHGSRSQRSSKQLRLGRAWKGAQQQSMGSRSSSSSGPRRQHANTTWAEDPPSQRRRGCCCLRTQLAPHGHCCRRVQQTWSSCGCGCCCQRQCLAWGLQWAPIDIGALALSHRFLKCTSSQRPPSPPSRQQ